MAQKLERIILFSLLGISYGAFSYWYFGGWWNSSLGSILIIFLSYVIWKNAFIEQIGLQLNFTTIIKSVILAVAVILGAYLVMRYISGRHHVVIHYTRWQDYYHDIFYILNEEIMLGAIPLFALIRKKKMKPITASITLALMFSLIHFVLYKWVMHERGSIQVITLVNLFLIGFVRNSLIVLTGHIGYSWALHFGWMVVMFGSLHTNSITYENIIEPDRFNLYLGSVEMLIISLIITTASIAYWIKTRFKERYIN